MTGKITMFTSSKKPIYKMEIGHQYKSDGT